jgi:hypothetical protein
MIRTKLNIKKLNTNILIDEYIYIILCIIEMKYISTLLLIQFVITLKLVINVVLV